MSETSAVVEKSLRSVFVGNIPYEATEDKLREIFSHVGPVVSFKLMHDRESGKPKGYGFCEYKDQETALSAMRNLNGYEIGGRPLRVDNACTEKSRMEMQSLMMGPVVESPYGPDVEPSQAPEAISNAVASLPPEQMFELMRQMQVCVRSNRAEAKTMLLNNPQLAYALLQAQVVMRIIDPKTAVSLLHGEPSANGAAIGTSIAEPSTNGTSVPAKSSNGVASAGSGGAMADFPSNSGPPKQQQGPPSSSQRPPHGGPPPPHHRGAPPPQMGGMQGPPPPQPHFPSQGRDFDLRGPPRGAGPDLDMRMPPGKQHPPPHGGGPMDYQPSQPDFDANRFGRGPGAGDFDQRDNQFMNGRGRGDRDSRGPGMRDPRASADDRDFRSGGPPPPEVHDPRSRGPPSMHHNEDFNRGGPGSGPPPSAAGGPPPNLAASLAGHDHEKANLIMQVLQLSDEQIRMLPPDQRASILQLKEQIQQSQH